MDAHDIHRDAVVVDAHNDLPVLLLLRNRGLGAQGVERYWSERWVPEARAGGVDVQVLPIYVAPEVAEASLRSTLLQLELIEREAAQTPEVALCRSGSEIDAALSDGKIALARRARGHVRGSASTSSCSRSSTASACAWCRSRTGPARCSPRARRTKRPAAACPRAACARVAELERLGILLDVSHLAAPSVDHVLELATRTVVATHSCARALRDHHRNLSDEHLRGIAATGGVIGMNVLPAFVDATEPTLDRVVDHIEHIAEVAGVDHVGLGPDFLREYMDAIYPQYEQFVGFADVDMKAIVPGLARERDLPNLTQRLVERGWAEADVRKVLGENWLRVFRESL